MISLVGRGFISRRGERLTPIKTAAASRRPTANRQRVCGLLRGCVFAAVACEIVVLTKKCSDNW